MSATNDNLPIIQPRRTWFGSRKARSKSLSENATDGSSSAGTCYMLHAILVMIHVVLVALYIAHWEHRVTLLFTPMNNDFWPVVLSASMQAFYTIYTAVLLFLTQRLAMSRTLVRRQKLTAIHDISGAWAGLGSALNSVRQQFDISSSWWMVSAVTAYLACISVLHVTSSTLLQIQTFNASTMTSVPTTLGWLNDLSNSSVVHWEGIAASLLVFNQLPGLVTEGLSNTTVYDIPQTNTTAGYATVNATTITSHCGLLPNISYSVDYNPLMPYLTNSMVRANFSLLGDETFLLVNASIPWSDQIQPLLPSWISTRRQPSEPLPQAGVVLMVSTLLDIDPSVQEALAVPIPWEVNNSSGVLEAYFVQCSLSAVSAEAVIDIQTKSLQNPVSASQSSRQWEINQWSSDTWQSVVGDALATWVSSGDTFKTGYEPSITEELKTLPSLACCDALPMIWFYRYIMSSVGLNFTAEYDQSQLWGVPISAVVLSPDKLEAAIARAAAQLIWIAGRMGTSNGGLQPGNGVTYVNEDMNSLRLNINLLPLSFAISASAIMMALALSTTRAFDVSSKSQAAIPHTGALQLLWLGHHSATVNEVLEDVEHPTEANLRRAGMIDVCFAKTISDQEESPTGRDDVI